MKPAVILLASTVLATGVSVALVYGLLLPRRGGETADGGSRAEPLPVVALEQRLAKLEDAVRGVREELAGFAAPRREAAPAIDEATIRQAVLAWLEERAEKEPGVAARAAEAVAAETTPGFERVLQRLRTEKLSFEEDGALWSSLSEADQRRLVGEFEALAEANPGSADAQVELANAYLHMSQAATNAAEKGELATKADQVFDKALALDEHHWEARFTKAVTLSFWPDFLGKKPEAIKHLRILMEQQESAAAKPEHASTYLFLGNLYAQQGKEAEARAIWERGLQRFPTSAELLGKVRR